MDKEISIRRKIMREGNGLEFIIRERKFRSLSRKLLNDEGKRKMDLSEG